MLENTLDLTTQSNQTKSTQSETNMDFTLDEHHKERINFHMRMLNYYLTQEKI